MKMPAATKWKRFKGDQMENLSNFKAQMDRQDKVKKQEA